MPERVKEYLDGKRSYETIARANGIGVRTLRGWVQKYQEQGADGLQERNGNSHYTSISITTSVNRNASATELK